VAKAAVALTCGGTLIVTNISGPALVVGNKFKLFNAGSYSGAFSSVQLPPLSASLAWNTSALNTGAHIVDRRQAESSGEFGQDFLERAGFQRQLRRGLCQLLSARFNQSFRSGCQLDAAAAESV
jgi:hypothetical protein